jgi:HK97 family phage major capsid protein
MAGPGEDLFKYLLETMYNMPPRERQAAHWVMNPEWWNECRKLADATGFPVVLPPMRPGDPACMLGKLVVITDDGGVPHLEPRATR